MLLPTMPLLLLLLLLHRLLSSTALLLLLLPGLPPSSYSRARVVVSVCRLDDSQQAEQQEGGHTYRQVYAQSDTHSAARYGRHVLA